jgi:hypothetical protein
MMSAIWLLACPLGMAAMGGVAWLAGRLPGHRVRRLRSAASRVSCMGSGSPQPVAVDEDAPAQAASSHV